MKTMLSDGRIFETKEFKLIKYNPQEPVYKYTFVTDDRNVKSSARHEWVVWNKQSKNIEMIKMSDITIEDYELITQGWND